MFFLSLHWLAAQYLSPLMIDKRDKKIKVIIDSWCKIKLNAKQFLHIPQIYAYITTKYLREKVHWHRCIPYMLQGSQIGTCRLRLLFINNNSIVIDFSWAFYWWPYLSVCVKRFYADIIVWIHNTRFVLLQEMQLKLNFFSYAK